MKSLEDVLKFLDPDRVISQDEQLELTKEYVEYELASAKYEVEVPVEDLVDAIAWGQKRFVILLMKDATRFCFSSKKDADIMQKRWGVK